VIEVEKVDSTDRKWQSAWQDAWEYKSKIEGWHKKYYLI